MEHYQKALEIQPQYAEAHNNLGNVLRQKGRVDEAIIQYQKAVEIEPDFAMAHYNLGMVLAQKGLADEAIAQFKETLRFKPDDTNAKEWLRRLGVPASE
jgi:tetratricopeptide (TPR) repeat protein